MKTFKVNLVKNKNNGQINFSIPKRKLSKQSLIDISKAKRIKISLEDFYEE